METLPASVASEKAVLGGILTDGNLYPGASDLRPEDFSLDSHRRIYRRIVDLAEAGKPISTVTVVEELEAHQELYPVGDVGYVSSLIDGAVDDTDHVRHHIGVIRDKAALRAWIRTADLLRTMATDPSASPEEVSKRATELLASRVIEGSRRLTTITVSDFITLQIPPREMLLGPIIQAQGQVELYGPRGSGKTNVALAASVVMAGAGQFAKWQAPKPRRVLYCDGEMPAHALQQRVREQLAGANVQNFDPNNLRFIAADLQSGPLADLATKTGQSLVERELDGVDLLVLDNLSCLVRSGKENEAESWTAIQEWLLHLRQSGIAVMFLHHAGKGGTQRGTSRREDTLDTVIALRRPSDYSAEEGLRVEVHFEKTRGFYGAEAMPFELSMRTASGIAAWTVRDLTEGRLNQAKELFSSGMSVRRVADELGISHSQAGRLKQKAGIES